MANGSFVRANIATDERDLDARLRAEADRSQRYNRQFSIIALRSGDASVSLDIEDLSDLLRPSDTVGQIGPGEYCILAAESPMDLARRIAERLWHHFSGRVPGSLSLGVAGYEGQEDTAAAVMDRARRAQAVSLARGGDQIAALSGLGVITVSDFAPERD